ncbi:C40 family peptidase [Sporomusa termitida]|uniref:Gamma-DL-glutamyl hydrolase n=1 Tax=Sporomusa termitida TaxID=2377 RepID=A0A517DW27_9FIRM|nr:C40 family peptidase [Sporomusa termitida]QDR81523.1 Gamma-DL-glutamyl hydrolase [Sporomusa termitida]
MRKWILPIILAGVLFGGTAVAAAAPAPGYNQFLQSLEAILAGAVMPVAAERQIPVFSPAIASRTALVVASARNLLGRQVVWGGASPAQGFDCSGLVQYVYRQAGVNLSRTADLQFMVGRTVAPADLQPGDLVYFSTYEQGASHVGIYTGGGKFIHTSFGQGIVAFGDMSDTYFVNRYYGAKRVL